MPVQVQVDDPGESLDSPPPVDDPHELKAVLARIETRLQSLDALITSGD